MTTTTTETKPRTIIERLAISTVSQFGAMPKGKKRDELTVTYWCGAWAGLNIAGADEDAAWVYKVLHLLIATRGFAECVRLADAVEKEGR